MTIAANGFDYEEWTTNDHLFHQTIFLSTGNQFYIPFANILSTIFQAVYRPFSRRRPFCLEEHKAI
ncbi:FCD domain-containing protein [Vibrio lentus]|nr:FCD domain-containing protein [Vibrio lentus]